MQKVCFACGATDHLMRDCPKNPAKVQNVEDDTPEAILFIGRVAGQARGENRREVTKDDKAETTPARFRWGGMPTRR